jgi:glucosamine-6-phosphate deaminase
MLSTGSKTEIRIFKKDKLTVKIYSSRDEMGKKAAEETARKITELLAIKDEINMIFAAAPSQNDFLRHLITDYDIEWKRVNAFHMDEYIGLDKDAPQGFGNFLKERLFGKTPFKKAYYLNGQAESPEIECLRYTYLLMEHPADIVCLGIGENGHIAFNDPPIADFNDPSKVKVVKLDQVCRQQQVNDNCFAQLKDVPTHAFTLTIPALLKADYMICIVPASNKAKAIYHTLNDEISENCPATILRTQENAVLYLDNVSSVLL